MCLSIRDLHPIFSVFLKWGFFVLFYICTVMQNELPHTYLTYIRELLLNLAKTLKGKKNSFKVYH